MANVICCSSCNVPIIGAKFTDNKKTYCRECFNKLLEEREQKQQEKEEVIAYLKELFGTGEIPPDVSAAIDREIKAGKRGQGIKLTLRYYYIIQGHKIDSMLSAIFVIKDFYEEAKKYYVELQLQKKRNAEVDLNVPADRVVLTRENLKPIGRGQKYSYNIEDL